MGAEDPEGESSFQLGKATLLPEDAGRRAL